LNRRHLVLGAWVVLVVAYTFAAGFQIPPREGVADPDDDESASSAAQLERMMQAKAGGADRLSLTPAVAAHGPAELLVIVSPERSPYPSEADAIDRFMQEGGTVVMFTSSPAWNDFLRDHRITIEGPTLLPTGNSTSANVLTLDLPTDLGPGKFLLPNATAVQASGANVTTYAPNGETVLDRNDNGTIDPQPSSDEAGSFDVAASTTVGEGRLVVVGSGEAVLGEFLELNNLDATSNMLETLGGGEASALDAGTHPEGYADVARAPAQATMAVGQAWIPGLATLAVLGLGVIVALPSRPIGQEEKNTLDEYTEQTREVLMRGGD